MLAEDMKPNRLERAKQEIADLVEGLRGDRVGIVVFAGDAFVLCPLTVDYGAALMFAKTADVDIVSKPGSAIQLAIEKSAALFPDAGKADRVIILVTDGESHEGDPLEEARKAAQKGIRIYTIGIGNPAGDLIPLRGTRGAIDGYKKDDSGETVLTRLDESTLREVAQASGGKYLPATREGLELKVLYREISGMEKAAIKGEFMQKKRDRFAWFFAAAFLLLVLDTMITSRGSVGRGRVRRVLHTGSAGAAVCIILGSLVTPASSASIDKGRVKSGNRYYEAGEYEKALVLYREALGDTTTLPENAEGVFYNEGNTLHMMGRYPEALQKYHESLAEDTLQMGRMLYNRGNTLLKMGQPAEAVESYVQTLRYLPDDLDARHNLELALRMIEQQEQQKQQQDSPQNQRNDQDSQENTPSDGQRRQDEEQSRQEPQQDQPQPPDSTGTQRPPRPDSSMTQPPPDSTQVIELSREDALRILKLLEEREEELQKEKRKAAFKRVRRSGKDW
jgi:Ca-activated chloride channel family protein